jgi:hypothetical protein
MHAIPVPVGFDATGTTIPSSRTVYLPPFLAEEFHLVLNSQLST